MTAEGRERKRERRGYGLCDVRQYVVVVGVLVLAWTTLTRRHCHRCLILTAGSLVHGGATTAVAGGASSVHDGGDRGAASWAATSGRDKSAREKGTRLYEGGAELLEPDVPERDLPAFRALLRGVEFYVRGLTNSLNCRYQQ